MSGGEPERLHPIEVLGETPVEAQMHQFVQPGHQQSGPVLAQVKNLRRLGVQGFREVLRIKTIPNQVDVLPEHLIDHIVRVEIDRRRGDMALGLAPAQRVRAERDHITNRDGLFAELTEQNR